NHRGGPLSASHHDRQDAPGFCLLSTDQRIDHCSRCNRIFRAMVSKTHRAGLLADVDLCCLDPGTSTYLIKHGALLAWLLRYTSFLGYHLDSCAYTAAPGNDGIVCATRSLLRTAGARTKYQTFERPGDYSVYWSRSETAVDGDRGERRRGTAIPEKSTPR